jgi:glycosyltransferase involved in cell wall biosynthesis
MPLIDVLIPAFNAETTVRSAIESMRRQSMTAIAIHVVDDGSTDATPRILAEMAAADPRLHVHRKENGGIVDALNFGLDFCTGEFVARHDADDLAYPNRLAAQLAYLQAHGDVSAVGAAVRHIDGAGVPIGTIARLGSPNDADPFYVPSREPYLIHPFLTVRRAAIEAAGRYRYVHHAEDTDLYWRLSERGRLHNLPEILGDYRLHDASISGRSIVNGRIMAVNSQLAGLSARRRRCGNGDIVFAKDKLAAYKHARSLAAMIDVAAPMLEPAEREELEESAAAKLLELTSYRPYELDAEDCAFIGRVARRGFAHLSAENRTMQERRISGAAARLAAGGQMRAALGMVPSGLYPAFAARYLSRVTLPGRLRDALRGGGSDKAAPIK